LILTSREKPQGLAALEGETLPVRCLQLTGLPEVQGLKIFSAKGSFTGSEDEWTSVISRYGGNPLALKIVASGVTDFFDSSISRFLEFLKQGSFIFERYRTRDYVLVSHQSRTSVVRGIARGFCLPDIN
jgi:hypothetical protein